MVSILDEEDTLGCEFCYGRNSGLTVEPFCQNPAKGRFSPTGVHSDARKSNSLISFANCGNDS